MMDNGTVVGLPLDSGNIVVEDVTWTSKVGVSNSTMMKRFFDGVCRVKIMKTWIDRNIERHLRES